MHYLTKSDAITWARSAIANAEIDSRGRPYYTCDFYQGPVDGVRGRSCFHKASRHVGLVNEHPDQYGRYYLAFAESDINRTLAGELMLGLREQREIEDANRKARMKKVEEERALDKQKVIQASDEPVENNPVDKLFDEAEPPKTHYVKKDSLFTHASMKVDKPSPVIKAPDLTPVTLKPVEDATPAMQKKVQQIEDELNASTLPDRIVAREENIDIDAIVQEEIAKIEEQKKSARVRLARSILGGAILMGLGSLITMVLMSL